jgi:hypothetical protein
MSSLVSVAESFSSSADDDVVGVEMLVELSADALLDGSEVIWARPTPAAAAKASPTVTPTSERRLNRLNRLCTWHPFDLREFGLTSHSRPRGAKLALRYFVKVKRARWFVPSRSVITKSWQVPAQAFGVAARNVYRSDEAL